MSSQLPLMIPSISETHHMQCNTLQCAVCTWAEDGCEVTSPTLGSYSQHFRTESHLRNYLSWCIYMDEQGINYDYMNEWLVQNSLVDAHSAVLTAELLEA